MKFSFSRTSFRNNTRLSLIFFVMNRTVINNFEYQFTTYINSQPELIMKKKKKDKVLRPGQNVHCEQNDCKCMWINAGSAADGKSLLKKPTQSPPCCRYKCEQTTQTNNLVNLLRNTLIRAHKHWSCLCTVSVNNNLVVPFLGTDNVNNDTGGMSTSQAQPSEATPPPATFIMIFSVRFKTFNPNENWLF